MAQFCELANFCKLYYFFFNVDRLTTLLVFLALPPVPCLIFTHVNVCFRQAWQWGGGQSVDCERAWDHGDLLLQVSSLLWCMFQTAMTLYCKSHYCYDECFRLWWLSCKSPHCCDECFRLWWLYCKSPHCYDELSRPWWLSTASLLTVMMNVSDCSDSLLQVSPLLWWMLQTS